MNVAGYWEMRESLFENRKRTLLRSDTEESGRDEDTVDRWASGQAACDVGSLFSIGGVVISVFFVSTLHLVRLLSSRPST